MADIEYSVLVREKKSTQPVIYTKIEAFQYNWQITDKAKDIYNKLNIKATRNDPQNRILYYCIYYAHLDLKIPIDYNSLAKMLNIPITGIAKALAINVKRKKYTNVIITPNIKYCNTSDYFIIYAKHTRFDTDIIETLNELNGKIMKLDPDLEDNPPSELAAAIILYFSKINGIDIDIDEFIRLIEQKKNRIIKLLNQIQRIDNQ